MSDFLAILLRRWESAPVPPSRVPLPPTFPTPRDAPPPCTHIKEADSTCTYAQIPWGRQEGSIYAQIPWGGGSPKGGNKLHSFILLRGILKTAEQKRIKISINYTIYRSVLCSAVADLGIPRGGATYFVEGRTNDDETDYCTAK